MINKVLLDYVRSENERGIKKETIHDMLVESGWELGDITSAMQEVFGPKPIMAPHAPMPSSPMPSSPLSNMSNSPMSTSPSGSPMSGARTPTNLPTGNNQSLGNNMPIGNRIPIGNSPTLNSPSLNSPAKNPMEMNSNIGSPMSQAKTIPTMPDMSHVPDVEIIKPTNYMGQSNLGQNNINPTNVPPLQTQTMKPEMPRPEPMQTVAKPQVGNLQTSNILGAIKNYGQTNQSGLNKPFVPTSPAPTRPININPTNIVPGEMKPSSASMPAMEPMHSVSPIPQMTNLGHKMPASTHMPEKKHYGKIGLTIILSMLILLTGVGIYAYYNGYFTLSTITDFFAGLLK